MSKLERVLGKNTSKYLKHLISPDKTTSVATKITAIPKKTKNWNRRRQNSHVNHISLSHDGSQ